MFLMMCTGVPAEPPNITDADRRDSRVHVAVRISEILWCQKSRLSKLVNYIDRDALNFCYEINQGINNRPPIFPRVARAIFK